MRKFCGRFAVLFLLTAALCCVSALAVEVQEGIIVDSANLDGISTVTAKTANGDAIVSATTIDNKDVYLDAERVTMTLADASADQNLIIVSKGTAAPNEVNIVYIDQQPGNGSGVSFDVFPKSLSKGTYTVWLANSSSAAKAAGTFEYSAPYMLGDVNDDKDILAGDARLILQNAAGSKTLTDMQKLAADVNKDGEILAGDARLVLRAAAGSIIL